MTPDFWLTSLVVILVPGTGVLFTVASGVAGGFARSLWAALGCTAGILPHLFGGVLGVTLVLGSTGPIFGALRAAGVVYLLSLAWQLWRARPEDPSAPEEAAADGWRVFRKAVTMNLLNPKLTLFFLAFLPQFVSGGESDPSAAMLLMGGAFMGLTFVVFAGYGAAAGLLGGSLRRNPRLIRRLNRGFALLLVTSGVRLALAE